jgi:hypothetical protein
MTMEEVKDELSSCPRINLQTLEAEFKDNQSSFTLKKLQKLLSKRS